MIQRRIKSITDRSLSNNNYSDNLVNKNYLFVNFKKYNFSYLGITWELQICRKAHRVSTT